MGFALPFAFNLVTQSSFPVLESIARNLESLVAPMKTRPPAVTIGPAEPPRPVFCLPAGKLSLTPWVVCHAVSSVLAFTAVSRPHGGFWHVMPLAENPEYGPGPFTLPRS